jgi:hypothetical protein
VWVLCEIGIERTLTRWPLRHPRRASGRASDADVVMILQARRDLWMQDGDGNEEMLSSWWALNSAGKKVFVWEHTLRFYYRLLHRLLRPEAESGIEGNHG